MITQPRKILALLCFIFSVTAEQNPYAQENQNIKLDEEQVLVLDSIIQNPSGKIYFFDNKEISEPDFYMKIFTHQLKEMTAYTHIGKKAIIRFGERYRNGIVFGEAKYKNETQGESKTSQNNESKK